MTNQEIKIELSVASKKYIAIRQFKIVDEYIAAIEKINQRIINANIVLINETLEVLEK